MAWTTPKTWATSELVTAPNMNIHIRDNFRAIGDAWTSITPTLTNWTVGNGAWSARYMEVGKLIKFQYRLTLGSTTAPSGNLVISLPVNRLDSTPRGPLGLATLTDTSASAFRSRFAVQSGVGGLVIQDEAGALVTATVPWTWATGDIINVIGQYEAA